MPRPPRLLSLFGGGIALVDAEDFEVVSKLRWSLNPDEAFEPILDVPEMAFAAEDVLRATITEEKK